MYGKPCHNFFVMARLLRTLTALGSPLPRILARNFAAAALSSRRAIDILALHKEGCWPVGRSQNDTSTEFKSTGGPDAMDRSSPASFGAPKRTSLRISRPYGPSRLAQTVGTVMV